MKSSAYCDVIVVTNIFKLSIIHNQYIINQHPLNSLTPPPFLTVQIYTHWWQEDSPEVFLGSSLFDFDVLVVLARADEDDISSESSSM